MALSVLLSGCQFCSVSLLMFCILFWFLFAFLIWISSLVKCLFISKSVFNPDSYTSKAKPVALSDLQ